MIPVATALVGGQNITFTPVTNCSFVNVSVTANSPIINTEFNITPDCSKISMVYWECPCDKLTILFNPRARNNYTFIFDEYSYKDSESPPIISHHSSYPYFWLNNTVVKKINTTKPVSNVTPPVTPPVIPPVTPPPVVNNTGVNDSKIPVIESPKIDWLRIGIISLIILIIITWIFFAWKRKKKKELKEGENHG